MAENKDKEIIWEKYNIKFTLVKEYYTVDLDVKATSRWEAQEIGYKLLWENSNDYEFISHIDINLVN